MSAPLPTSAESHPFLVRDWDGRYYQAPRLVVRWREVNRTKRVIGGLFREVEHDHWDHTALVVSTTRPTAPNGHEGAQVFDGPEVVRANGLTGRPGEGATVPNNGEGVAKVVRRIGAHDAEAVAFLDAEILAHQAAIQQLRTDRAEVIQSAWRRARPVLVHDLRPEREQVARYVEAPG